MENSGVSLADIAEMVFGFVPESVVIGPVRQDTYGLPTNVNENADSDFDRMTHEQEFIAATSPVDGSRSFVLNEPVPHVAAAVTVRWLAQAYRRYRVLHTPNLVPPVTWTEVYAPVPVDTAREMEYIHPAGGETGYFQVDVRFP